MRALRQPGDPGPPGGRVEVRKVGPVHQHPAPRRGQCPAQQCQQRALARAARPDQRDDLTAANGQVDALRMAQPHPVQPERVEPDRHGKRPPAGHAGAVTGTGISTGMNGGADTGGRGVDRVEGRASRGQAGNGRMILHPHLPQRQVDFRGEQQREQSGTQVQRTRHQPQADGHRDQRHRQGRQQLQHERGQERPAQRHHGLFPVGIGDPADHLHLGFRPIEDLQRRQSLDHVEKMPGQPPEHRPLLVGSAPGGKPHQDHEGRDQRQGDSEHDRGGEIRTGDPDQHERRDNHHHHQGR